MEENEAWFRQNLLQTLQHISNYLVSDQVILLHKYNLRDIMIADGHVVKRPLLEYKDNLKRAFLHNLSEGFNGITRLMFSYKLTPE